MADTVGGRYELLDEIDSGGMGTIWRAFDVVLDREVAVKRISPQAIGSGEAVAELAKRFQREARVTARILHHGVPQVYDAGLDSGVAELYLVMELVHGVPLRAFIERREPLPISWAAAFGAQIATVLSHAHAIPVVHRDLKPENVLVTDDGGVKVLDFGIAAVLRPDTGRLTATGTPMGTSLYMSPEQIRGRQVTPHSDLYALGCVLYELVSGYPVFGGDTNIDRWNRHLEAVPVPLREVCEDVPAEFDRLVLDLLAKAPTERPADATEVYERLLPLLPTLGSRPEASGPGSSGMPDPTLVFRRPNAPGSRAESGPVLQRPSAAESAAAASRMPRTALRESIQDAVNQADALLEDERFVQAAEVLDAVIQQAGNVLGAENPQVLQLRLRRAAILVVAGEYRLARPEFDALAEAFARTKGPRSDHAVESLRQAAYCRAELGQVDEALLRLNDVLDRISSERGDGTDTALEVRRNIGELQAARNDIDEAEWTLRALHDDLLLIKGSDNEDTRYVAELLERLRSVNPG
ncbi:serine/threonine protein kinase [Saccharomonospora marina XMU15]|uniref:non-specific serine/threonine protein kinase n=1 Tax=Saccharomonospora marina XMU15 TaxID=882083 RepID=H5WWN5_9PSEU|nr:serine/threonine-protein kinase [Saccharomonospora marina]EHR51648.1 serine/threonine protein kinase [Saccharomonospora marina XMU15]